MFELFQLTRAAIEQTKERAAAGRDAARAEHKAAAAQSQARLVEANLARVLLICEALWEILRDKFGLSDEQLREKIQEIDLRDGTLDEKCQRKAVECPGCGHTVSGRHPACLYCGQIIDDSIFTTH
jgi:hypothetical protein